MDVKKKKIITNNYEIKPTHCFVLGEKRFPFNYYIFEINSLYCQHNENELFAKKEINIFGDDETKINIKDEDINILISLVSNEYVELTNENVPALYYLSNRYEIPSLMVLLKIIL